MTAAPIRIGVRAVILQDEKILLVKFDDENGAHYNNPGGGMECGETAPDAVLREIREETNADAEVVRLLGVYEYLAPGNIDRPYENQKLELIFLCRLKDNSMTGMPENPDLHQVSVDWVPLCTLEVHLIYPPIARMVKERLGQLDGPDAYFGNCFHFPVFT